MQVFNLILIPLLYPSSSIGFDDLPSDFLYFPNLEAIKKFFRNDSNPLSSKMVDVFEQDCLYMPDPGAPPGKRKPLIVIEGNHRASRNVIGMKLARRLNGRYLTNLAPCLLDYFAQLPQGSLTRRVFYLLSIYAAVFNAKIHLNLNRAVIINGWVTPADDKDERTGIKGSATLDFASRTVLIKGSVFAFVNCFSAAQRYWWEQVTFSLIQAMRGEPPPPVSHDVFAFPHDLLQPDLIVYVDQPKEPSTQSYRSAELYRNLSARYPIMIQTMNKNYRTAIDEVYYSVRENLTDTRDFRYKAAPNYDFR